MLENLKSDVKTLILLKITKRLIENTPNMGMYKLKKLTENKQINEPIRINLPTTKQDIRDKIKQEVKEKLSYIPSLKIQEGDSYIIVDQENKKRMSEKLKKANLNKPEQQRPQPIRQPIQRQAPIQRAPPMPQRRPLPIPQAHSLPAHLQYLKPTMEQIKPKEIDLGKLNPLIEDRNVKSIEIEGSDQPVYVSGMMGRKPTAEKLSEDEIKEIINKFSKESKVPATDGVFKVLVGHLQLTAIVSDSIGTRFVIKKIQ